MKKTNNLFLIMLLLVGTLGFVVADEEEESDIPEAKKVGFFEDRMDRIKFAFTFNKEKKIERALTMAEKRLAETEVLAEEDPEAYERAQERYDELVARAEEILEDMESEAEDAEDSVENIERVARIQNKFERHRSHADEIYTRARERFEANNASDEKLERFEMFHERALNRSYKMEERILERRENIIQKHKTLTEMDDEELEELLVKIEDDEGLKAAREKRVELAEIRVEKLEQIGEKRLEMARERLNNADLSEEEKAKIRERLEDVEMKLDRFGDLAKKRIATRVELSEEGAENLQNVVESELSNLAV
ncbi:DUF5667 domain-containing protein [archaeon]|nr:DUF5667 domain-containing protein [archaeon]